LDKQNLCQITSPDISQIACCQRGYDRPYKLHAQEYLTQNGISNSDIIRECSITTEGIQRQDKKGVPINTVSGGNNVILGPL
jgi:hypothetical protein